MTSFIMRIIREPAYSPRRRNVLQQKV